MRKWLLMIALLSSMCILCSCKFKTESDINSEDSRIVSITPTITLTPTIIPANPITVSNTPTPTISISEINSQGNKGSYVITPAPTYAPPEEQPKLSKEEQKRLDSLRKQALEGKSVEIKNGDYFDLDGDGYLEQIKYERTGKNHYERSYLLTIGNATKAFMIDAPTDKLYLSNMTNDGVSLQILIDDYGDSCLNIVNIFYYKEGIIYDLGDIGGLVDDIKSLGDGLYECRERADTLQTWFHPRKFYISDMSMGSYDVNDNYVEVTTPVLVRMPKEMYLVNTRVILLHDLFLYKTQFSITAEVKLEKNQYATIVTSDDEEWIYIQGDVNGAGWIRIEELPEDNTFIGLSNAG
ncbi:hypothetical protein [Lachnoclostridium phytofermentans]|uniref:SH3 domain-containing protein n=1 Tax=Lachnoclostridium phytofermentans (strain ATCC 700394 / DSM 18823 / ISDg) TaxID=357809 RepID=A9KTC6_LACP7|nr:hypothetical protein [Lachnoclostridium phytofermentans]ABX43756.1 hypothetical protein Cphy_3403 [Lachnoclostridium phytofermentans ISDg]